MASQEIAFQIHSIVDALRYIAERNDSNVYEGYDASDADNTGTHKHTDYIARELVTIVNRLDGILADYPS